MAATPTAALRQDFTCLTGIVRRAEEIGFIQRGTHRLVDLQGRVIAALRSNQVNLFGLEGQFLTVCGISEGRIEGVLSLLVTQVFPVRQPTVPPVPPPQQIDLRTLLLFLLLTRQISPLLLFLLLSGGLDRTGIAGLGLGLGGPLGLSVTGLGTTGLGGTL